MSEFIKYHSLERLGTSEVAEILNGECYIFPKIDGTNGSLWWDENNGGLQAGSRNRHLNGGEDNAGFLTATRQDARYEEFFRAWPGLRLYGEWLVPHSLKTYHDEAWRKFYVFDVSSNDGAAWLHYDSYSTLLDQFNIEYIPAIFKCTNPTEDRIYAALEQNDFLIRDGQGKGEGVVIKNYNFVNKYGRSPWAKVVTSEFKAKHTKELGVREVTEKYFIEEKIAVEFVTSALVDKTYAKIKLDVGGFGGKEIPRLLNTVYYDIINEDMWEILKQHKNATIDFARLNRCVIAMVKKIKPSLFGG